MKIVIDIDEDYYTIIKHDVDRGMDYKPCVIIANGKPLPKGHGRLIDETKLEDIIHDKGFNSKFMNPVFTMTEVADMMDDVPTVIEADEEEGAE